MDRYLNYIMCAAGFSLVCFGTYSGVTMTIAAGAVIAGLGLYFVNTFEEFMDNEELGKVNSRFDRLESEIAFLSKNLNDSMSSFHSSLSATTKAGDTTKVRNMIEVLDERLKRVENQTQFFG